MTKHWTAWLLTRHEACMPAAIIMSALLGLSSPAIAGTVAGIDIADDSITVRFNDPVERASSFVLAGPNRIALDIVDTDPGEPVEPSGPVDTIRQGRFAANSVRVVFDLNTPTLVTGGRFSKDGRELKLAIVPVGDRAIEEAAHAPRKIYVSPVAQSARPPRSRYSLNIALDPPEPGLPRPVVSGRANRPLVVIDAGHGGHDPGAVSPTDATREKDITLAVAKAIRDELIRGGRVRVALTRDDDRFLILPERAQIARGLKADLFISIHADSAPNTGATGATIYTLSEVASDATAARLAARENKVDIINGVNLSGQGSDVSSILIDLAQRETMNASSRFADVLRREATGEVPFRGEFHRMAGFAVLKAPDTPAVLLEVGYVTNPVDVARLTSPEGRAAIAGAVRRAVDIQFARKMAVR